MTDQPSPSETERKSDGYRGFPPMREVGPDRQVEVYRDGEWRPVPAPVPVREERDDFEGALILATDRAAEFATKYEQLRSSLDALAVAVKPDVSCLERAHVEGGWVCCGSSLEGVPRYCEHHQAVIHAAITALLSSRETTNA